MSSHTVLITGGNTGLGLEIVRALYESTVAYNILLGSRSLEKAHVGIESLRASSTASSLSTIEPVQIDIEDDASIAKAFEFVDSKFGQLDVLINNAGAMFDQEYTQGKLSLRDTWNKTWSLNTTSTHIMTWKFVPLLLKSSNPRLIFIASGTSTLSGQFSERLPIDQPPAKGWPKETLGMGSYRSSKAGMNMMMREWARILKQDGVKVWACSPGLLATGLGGNKELLKKMGALDPAVGAELIKSVVEGMRDADIGKVVNRQGVQEW